MDAKKIGLVDSLGGLEQAIEEAVAMAELGKEYEIKEFPRLQNPLQQFIQELSGNEGSKPKLKAELEQWLAEEFPQYQLKLQLEEMKGLQMRLPFQLNENNQQSKLYSIH
jgi:protease-4